MSSEEPLEYVIGFKEFLGCKIDLSKKPLIPRPETKFWVGKAIEGINQKKRKDLRVLDIFSGSGCIGIAFLANVKDAIIDFADNDKKFIEQIEINLDINKSLFSKKSRFAVIKSDIFSNIKSKYDYIFANPPYIPTINENLVQKSVLLYEPRNALFAGEDGLLYIRKFISEALNFLKDKGQIFMEFDPPQKKEIEKLIKEYGYKTFKFGKDQYNKTRYVIIK